MNDFPHFKTPPVGEVALSVQFEPLQALHAVHFGLLWQEFRDTYPKTQEHQPLPPVTEKFGVHTPFPQGLNFSFGVASPTLRCWFLNEDETQLIQVQQDRFIHNWRKRQDGQGPTYPRYRVLRESFKAELGTFFRFLEKEGVGLAKPNQCELVYVNQINVRSVGLVDHGDFSKIVTAWSDLGDPLLSRVENVGINARYFIKNQSGEPIGRLHITFNPLFIQGQNEPAYQAQFLGRGAPLGEGLEGVFEFLDKAHEYAVRAFLAVTSPSLQEMWGIYRA
jgi:uncharacterized protein (TIGR04255 family)